MSKRLTEEQRGEIERILTTAWEELKAVAGDRVFNAMLTEYDYRILFGESRSQTDVVK